MHFPARAASILLLCCVCVAHAQPLADRIPDSALFYIGWKFDPAVSSTLAAKMLFDERITKPWRALVQKGSSGDADEASAAIPEEIFDLLSDLSQCQGCFSIIDW